MEASVKRIVITGGPGFGKTSIINELEKRGYACNHEISRSIIKAQLEKGGDILPWKNLEAFSRIIIEKRIEQFDCSESFEIAFFDRGIPDVIAYMIKANLELPSSYIKSLEEYNYSENIFITPPWNDIFLNDAERFENFEEACEAHFHIEKTYKDLGYKLVELPKISVKERVDFILSHFNN